MSEIRIKENESLESALRRFKRSCAKEGVIAVDQKTPCRPAGRFLEIWGENLFLSFFKNSGRTELQFSGGRKIWK